MRIRVAIGLGLALLAGCWVAWGQLFIGRPFLVPGSCSFIAETAVFDGSNDYMRKSTALTGLADGRTFTASFWVRFDGADNITQAIITAFRGGFVAWQINRTGSAAISLDARKSDGTVLLDALSSVTLVAASGWTHVYICIDLANSANRKIYFDGVADGSVTWTTYTDDVIDLDPSSPIYTVGANANNNNKLNGALTELWFDDIYLDLPDSFRCDGSPADIGTNGQTPSGSAPVIYFSRNGSGDAWVVDSSGNGNTFTLTGTLGNTTPP